MYLYKRVKTPHRDFVTRTKCFYYNLNSKGKKRGIRSVKTSESKQARNRRMSYLHKKYLIYNNFDVGDMWITLTWRKEELPKDAETAHKILMKTLAKINRKLKRKNIPFVFFIKTEAGEHQRVHHHLFIKNNFDVIALIFEHWQEFGKIFDCTEIYSLDDGKLVKYFLDGGDHKGLNFEKYSHSRNMKEPEVETRVFHYSSFKEIPKPPKATDDTEYIIQNLYNGYADSDGYAFQEYEIAKIKKTDT